MDPLSVHTAAYTALDAIAHVTVYDGDVPEKPPADTAGRVLPYLVLWANPGRHLPDSENLASSASTALSADLTITCAGGTQARVLQVAHLARNALLGVVLTGCGPASELTAPRPVQIDRNVTPARFYTVLTFRLTAP